MLSQPIFLHIDSSILVFYQIFLGLSLVFICWFIFTDAKEGNVFRSVCHSVPLPVPGDRHPLWRQIPSPASRHPQKEHETRQEVTSYTPCHWHLVAATAVVGMHPTEMHSWYHFNPYNLPLILWASISLFSWNWDQWCHLHITISVPINTYTFVWFQYIQYLQFYTHLVLLDFRGCHSDGPFPFLAQCNFIFRGFGGHEMNFHFWNWCWSCKDQDFTFIVTVFTVSSLS